MTNFEIDSLLVEVVSLRGQLRVALKALARAARDTGDEALAQWHEAQMKKMKEAR